MDKGDWSLQALDRSSSDHKGLCLSAVKNNWGLKPFKIFNCWLENPELKLLLEGLWSRAEDVGGNIQLTLKNLKKAIKDWFVYCLGDLDKKIHGLELQIN